jgi:hypothetical protein
MKKCFVCGLIKPFEEYYSHNGMADGKLNKCKVCCKNQSVNRYAKLSKDPKWMDAERKRHSEKDKKTINGKRRGFLKSEKYYKKYPEKKIAKTISQRVVKPEGKHGHHWSYNEEHYKDLVFLKCIDHNTAHRFIIYDQERMMYRTINGILLDTKEAHIEYINQFINEKINLNEIPT